MGAESNWQGLIDGQDMLGFWEAPQPTNLSRVHQSLACVWNRWWRIRGRVLQALHEWLRSRRALLSVRLALARRARLARPMSSLLPSTHFRLPRCSHSSCSPSLTAASRSSRCPHRLRRHHSLHSCAPSYGHICLHFARTFYVQRLCFVYTFWH